MNSTPVIDHPEYLRHRQWMNSAIALAQAAGAANEVPVGAVIVDSQGNIIASAENRRERDKDPTAHAEILALRQAGQVLQNWYLSNCTLYVTLEPCPMCAGAIIQARLKLLVYGADDPKTGAIRTVANIPDSACSYHRVTVIGGILESACRAQLQAWFARQRQLKQHGKANRDEEL
ncbi:tRNA adenosine(34) deaminase TadA [Chroogloeocystis siderophila]|uniref:tRNA-specific adenosine deaminase n=1 Tax=Chroogloeocystis siderophila 5.2 s.c.1 TaxID=247279 RepID=A0A1U7I048_9CHRO|nr:tRNA adenosine(34) deaminase TadA [Chroogloeocystis siderophila]OKH29251.1 tRNA-specific adenosine deaminase [Chroogloeocystis siderophila 5.2 s.c.1]